MIPNKKESRKVCLTSERDIPILLFLWKWKLSTTAAIAARFFPETKIVSAYNRLNDLWHGGFVTFEHIKELNSQLWILTKKGFNQIQGLLLAELKDVGYLSENPYHDFIVSAVHLGEWLPKTPPGCEFFSEQELRRFDEDHYPDWVPQCKFSESDKSYHRPDGYWHVQVGEKKIAIALEVERSLQKPKRYKSIGNFYSSQTKIYSVLWVVTSLSQGRNISEKMQKQLKEGDDDFHNFVIINDFFKHGWNAKICVGRDTGQTISQVLYHAPVDGRKNSTGLPQLDTRKNPLDSTISQIPKTLMPIV
jgi:hypothetical protein